MSVSDVKKEGKKGEARLNVRCSFCRKTYLEVEQLISAPQKDVYICGECVDECAELVKQFREVHSK